MTSIGKITGRIHAQNKQKIDLKSITTINQESSFRLASTDSRYSGRNRLNMFDLLRFFGSLGGMISCHEEVPIAGSYPRTDGKITDASDGGTVFIDRDIASASDTSYKFDTSNKKDASTQDIATAYDSNTLSDLTTDTSSDLNTDFDTGDIYPTSDSGYEPDIYTMDTSEDLGSPDSGVEQEPPFTLHTNEMENECIRSRQVPEEVRSSISRCMSIMQGSYQLLFDNNRVQVIEPEIGDFLIPEHSIRLTISGEGSRPEFADSANPQALIFDPDMNGFQEDMGNQGSYITGRWTARNHDASILATSWDGFIKMFIDIPYAENASCLGVYNAPAGPDDVECNIDK